MRKLKSKTYAKFFSSAENGSPEKKQTDQRTADDMREDNGEPNIFIFSLQNYFVQKWEKTKFQNLC